MAKSVILTGLRANNDLHIGNYFGGLLPLIDMAKNKANDYEINLFVPDLHSFTTPIDHGKLQNQIMHNLKLFVAAGLPLDNHNVHIYRQSHVPAHSELTWILDCFTGFGEMRRMTQFKEKRSNLPELFDIKKVEQNAMQETDALHETDFDELEERIERAVSVGLFNYPVLMAADILLYGAKYVPVGDDQTQHLEFTRNIAERMNNKFGNLFVLPEPVNKQHEFFGKDQGLRIKDLADPTKKMSKSTETDKGVIFLGDEPSAAAKKVKGAATDSVGGVNLDVDNQPGVSNLLQILSLLRGESLEQTVSEHRGNASYGEFKQTVANEVEQFLVNFQSRLVEVDETSLVSKLEADEATMNEVANNTLERVQQAVGLRPKQ